jgi:hypothetical protein
MSAFRLLTKPRFGWIAVLACILVIRLLTPVGFMPAWEAGFSVVPCDGAGPLQLAAAEAADHHGHHAPEDQGGGKAPHQPCPYAAAAVHFLAGSEPTTAVAAMTVAIALLLGRTFQFIERHRRQERPPLRGPPALA